LFPFSSNSKFKNLETIESKPTDTNVPPPMGSSESKSKPNPTQNLSAQAFLQKWPQNARGFSGDALKDHVYVAIIYSQRAKANKTWLAFKTRPEALQCLKEVQSYHGLDYKIQPFVYYDPRYDNVTYWVSVVSRKQAREEGLYCGEEEENPEEDTSDAAAENPEGHPAGIPEPSAPGFDMSAFGIRK